MTLVMKICREDGTVLFAGPVREEDVSVVWHPDRPSVCTIRRPVEDMMSYLYRKIEEPES